MKRRYIAVECLPPRLPIFQGLVIWLVLDRLSVHPIVWGVVGTLWALWLIAAAWDIADAEEADLPGFGRKK